MHTVLAYLRYWLKARNSHSIHAPFLYHFYREVIAVKKRYYAFDALNYLRTLLKRNHTRIKMEDFGAGSRTLGELRTVAQIARTSAISPKEGELLFRIVNELSPKTIVELGTSLGLSTLYMAMARRQGRIHTFEGCPETAQIAQKNFKLLEADNIKIHVGNIDKTLPALLPKVGKVDMAYLDANHQYEPTVRYFNQLLPAMSEEGLLIFDDIHWSEGMQRAWQEVVKHPEVSLTVDLFAFGLVFVSKKYSKEHFVLRF